MNLCGWRIVGRLVVAHARAHPGRVLFTAFSTITAAAIVVWVVSGYDALVDKFDDFAEGYLGRYQLVLVPDARGPQFGGMGAPGGSGRALPAELIEKLATDPDVLGVDPVFQTRARIVNPDRPAPEPRGRGSRGQPSDGNPQAQTANGANGRSTAGEDAAPPSPADAAQMMNRVARQPALVGTDAVEPPHPLVAGRWIDVAHPEQPEGVLTRVSAEMLGVSVGDRVEVSAGTGFGPGAADTRDAESQSVKIVGIAEQPKTLPPPKFMIGLPPTRDAALRRGPASSALYVSKQLAEAVAGRKIETTYAGLIIKPGADPGTVQHRWAAEFASAKLPYELQSLADVEAEIDGSTTTEVVRTEALSATGIALLAALFIIYTTLSMGVHERTRQFAILRAVALSKSHITALILLESAFLGFVGWGGGLLAGWGLLSLVKSLRGAANESISLGFWCVVLSGVCALGGSLAAALLPAWQATRVSPLDAMAPRR
ncbi:MAG TPA: ABC transporter permease, partial [Pirellulales bacterium]|nr:ABC transporter permease [Pirellulales bacterium]